MHKHNCFQDSQYPTHWKTKLAENVPVSHDFSGLQLLSVLCGAAQGKGKGLQAVPSHTVIQTPATTETLMSVPELSPSHELLNKIWIQTSVKLEGLDPTHQPGSTYWRGSPGLNYSQHVTM